VQVLIELMAAFVVWAAATVFAPFGIDVDLARPPQPQAHKVVERSAAPAPEPAEEDCPEQKAARLRRV
jgi:hypothetical protein